MDDATFKRVGQGYTLGLERRLPHPPEKVWRVLTERSLLKQWFPCDVEGEWKVGAELRFTFRHGEHEGLSEEELKGEVIVVDFPRRLEFLWGSHLIRCELIPEGEGCRLLFSESFVDPSMGARSAAGWEMCLDNLDLVLDGVALGKIVWSGWRAKFEKYVKKFEPRVGPQQGPPANHPAAVGDETGPGHS